MSQTNASAVQQDLFHDDSEDDREGLNEHRLFIVDDPRLRRKALNREMCGPLNENYGFVDGRYTHLKCGKPAKFPGPPVCEACGPDTDD